LSLVIATTQQTVGIVIAVLLSVGWVVYLVANYRRARPEVGSEIELAPNRKPYLADEELEGRKLEQAQLWGLISLAIIAIGLPLYWLAEPGRQASAEQGFERRAIDEGARLFATTEAGGFDCAGCHGGMLAQGGVAPYVLEDPDGRLRSVDWAAPRLDTSLLKFSEDEVREILVFGRPFSPMPAWGLEGGGPMNEQMIDSLIAYMQSITLSPEEVLAENEELHGDDGAELFDAFCARCHTTGWSYGEPDEQGSGAFGPRLLGGRIEQQFVDQEAMVDFLTEGTERGEQYGRFGWGSGRMPGFGQVLSEAQIEAIVEYVRGL
jgi:mono/diheme cytochrome c family protein